MKKIEQVMGMIRPMFKAAWQVFLVNTVQEKGPDLSTDYLQGLKEGYWAGVSDATRIGMSVSTLLPDQCKSPSEDHLN